MTKKCTYCKIEKELSEFSIKKNGLFGKNSNCKNCVKLKSDIRKVKTLILRNENKLITEKKCSKCNKIKIIDNFTQDTSKSNGFYSSCKSCNKQYVVNYRNDNKVKISESKKKAVLKKIDYYSNYKKQWHQENREVISKRAKENYSTNRSEILAKSKEDRKVKRKLQLEEYSKIENLECKKCKSIKPKINFIPIMNGKFGYRIHCIECIEKKKLERQENSRLRSSEYYTENRESLIKYGYQKKLERLNSDPIFKFKALISHRIRRAIVSQNGTKSKRTLNYLGCSIEEARIHIEKQFTKGMNWNNHGNYGWHIDHIKPCSKFDLTNEEEQKECFNYKNLQPLWAKDNLSKGNKYIC